jgi:hypothetical protein
MIVLFVLYIVYCISHIKGKQLLGAKYIRKLCRQVVFEISFDLYSLAVLRTTYCA